MKRHHSSTSCRQILDAHARQAGADRGAQLTQRAWDRHGVAFLEFEPAIFDRSEAVARQSLFRGAHGPIEFGGELGQEYLSVGRQIEALVGLLASLLPFPVIIDQVPERDVIAALRQEQTAGTQGVAHREGEGDFPDGAVEFAAGDQMGAPVRLHEAMRIIRRQRAAGAGIQGAQDLDGPEQCLAAGGGLEWQGKEGGQVLAQRAVAREHGIEVAALFQPLIGPARDGGFDQFRRAQRIAEGGDGLRAIGRDQRIDGAKHAVQPVAGAAAQTLALIFDRIARPAVHAGEEQIVHLDDLVEQRLAGLDQIAGNQRVALRLGEAAEIAGIITASELAQLADDLRIKVIQPAAGAEQLLDQAQADDVALDHRGVGRFRIVLEPEQAGACIALRHFDQQVDGNRASFSGRRLEIVSNRSVVAVGHDGGDDPLQRAGAWQHDLPARATLLRPGSAARQRCGLPWRPRAASRASGLRRVLSKRLKAQITANALCLHPLRRFAAGPVEEQHRRQSELTRQMIDDLDRRVPVVVEEAAVAHAACRAAGRSGADGRRRGTSAITARSAGRQAPVPRQLVLARIGWHRHPSPGLRCRG